MSKPNTSINSKSFDELVVIAQHFVAGYQRFEAISQESQESIRELIGYMSDPSLDDDDRDAVYASIAQSLFREVWDNDEDVDFITPEDPAIAAEMDREESEFAQRVLELMQAKNLTQVSGRQSGDQSAGNFTYVESQLPSPAPDDREDGEGA